MSEGRVRLSRGVDRVPCGLGTYLWENAAAMSLVVSGGGVATAGRLGDLMARRGSIGWMLVVASLGIACGGSPEAAVAGGVPWAASLDAARSQAARDNKLVMVEFYASWCGWCKRFETRTLSDERVVRALAAVVPVRLDAEGDGQPEAQRLGVRGYPTIVFMDSDGREVGRIPGYLDPAPFLQELTDILKRS